MVPAISPSQIETWRSCNRKWAFQYVSGLPRAPESRAQRIGIALHAKAERFIQTGETDYSSTTEEEAEAARLLPAIVPYLPRGAQSEQKVAVTIDGIQFAGRYDWLTDAELGDLKTTSSLRWAKTAEELSVGPQAIIYSKAVGERWCRWLYAQTRGAAHVREVKFRPEFSALEGIVSDAKKIVKAWTDRGDPNTYTPNLSACDMYGGCPYKMHCRIDAGERLVMLMGIKGPSARKEKTMSNDFDALMNALQGTPSPAPVHVHPAINPPPIAPATEVPPVIDPTKAEAPKPEAPPKRKRRTKAEMAAAREQAGVTVVESPEALVQSIVDTVTDHDTEPPAADTPIGTLLISTMPLTVADMIKVENATYLFAAANSSVAEAFGVSDYRQIDFGKGAGALAEAVATKVRDLRPEFLYVDARLPEATVCLATLIALSRHVYRGV